MIVSKSLNISSILQSCLTREEEVGVEELGGNFSDCFGKSCREHQSLSGALQLLDNIIFWQYFNMDSPWGACWDR